MLDAQLKEQLHAYLGKIQRPITLTASLDASPAAQEMRDLLQQIASLSDKVILNESGTDARKPSFVVSPAGQTHGVRFAAVPLGHEFTTLVLALLWTGGHPPKVGQEIIDRIVSLETDCDFEAYISLSCHNCPDVAQALALMATLNPRIKATIIDGGLYQNEVESRQVMAVPKVYLNGENFGSGRMLIEEIIAKLDVNSEARDALALSAKAPYDVLIVGGGPAGAAAAVYAARKGIRVGMAAERFGGQTNDTLGIENYPSVAETNGPKFAAALEAQVKHYDVDVMNFQRAEKLVSTLDASGLMTVHMANGATLKAKTIILSTGARWRNINVPGEEQYKNKGVAYCPHCDGPLFKGKHVAVIGGGNSGVEAAIDLAGVVGHVTLFEFAEALKADAVLVRKLQSLANVSIHTNAQTAEITGDGSRVNGLSYKERASGEIKHIALEGVFVQIGLVPNTEWLKGEIELSRHGEIVVDAKGGTNMPGVFAAGDCTVTPFKQIVIAAGDGAKSALSAFDHLIRLPVAEKSGRAVLADAVKIVEAVSAN